MEENVGALIESLNTHDVLRCGGCGGLQVPHVSCGEMSPGQQTPSHAHTTSMAGGLVTSAAASLASIWRGWTTNR